MVTLCGRNEVGSHSSDQDVIFRGDLHSRKGSSPLSDESKHGGFGSSSSDSQKGDNPAREDPSDPVAEIPQFVNTALGPIALPRSIGEGIPRNYHLDPIVKESTHFLDKAETLERVIEIPHIEIQHEVNQVPVHMQVRRLMPQVQEVVRHVPKIVHKPYFEKKIMEIPQGVKYVEHPVPITVKRPPKIVAKPVVHVVERVVERIKPVITEEIVRVPHVTIKKVPRVRVVEVPYYVPKYVEKVVEMPYRPEDASYWSELARNRDGLAGVLFAAEQTDPKRGLEGIDGDMIPVETDDGFVPFAVLKSSRPPPAGKRDIAPPPPRGILDALRGFFGGSHHDRRQCETFPDALTREISAAEGTPIGPCEDQYDQSAIPGSARGCSAPVPGPSGWFQSRGYVPGSPDGPIVFADAPKIGEVTFQQTSLVPQVLTRGGLMPLHEFSAIGADRELFANLGESVLAASDDGRDAN